MKHTCGTSHGSGEPTRSDSRRNLQLPFSSDSFDPAHGN
jgi:hypothetical protein